MVVIPIRSYETTMCFICTWLNAIFIQSELQHTPYIIWKFLFVAFLGFFYRIFPVLICWYVFVYNGICLHEFELIQFYELKGLIRIKTYEFIIKMIVVSIGIIYCINKILNGGWTNHIITFQLYINNSTPVSNAYYSMNP